MANMECEGKHRCHRCRQQYDSLSKHECDDLAVMRLRQALFEIANGYYCNSESVKTGRDVKRICADERCEVCIARRALRGPK